MGPIFEALHRHLLAEEPVALTTVIEVDPEAAGAGFRVGATMLVRPHDRALGSLGNPGLDEAVSGDATGQIGTGDSVVRHYGPNGEARQSDVTVFVHVFAPSPHMVIYGAVDFTAALAALAKLLGYRVTVCDARATFATAQRFPMADEVVVDWPDRHLAKVGPVLGPRDAVCVLTHDLKFDVGALLAALDTEAGYIGAMGSRRTTSTRREQLRRAGVSEEALGRIMAPIGLDIGARTPAETAVSICAEIVALRAKRPGTPLRASDGPIHHRPAP